MALIVSLFIFLNLSFSDRLGFGFSGNSAHADDVGQSTITAGRRPIERIEPLKLWSFSFGPAGANNTNNPDLNYAFTLARHWEVNEYAEIRTNVHTTLPSNAWATFSSFGLGGSWFPLARDISPILGGEVGYGYALIPDLPDKSGFMLGAHGGVRLFRSSKAQGGVEAYYKTLAFVAGDWPTDFGLNLSVLY